MQPPAIKTVSIGLKELRRGVQSSTHFLPDGLYVVGLCSTLRFSLPYSQCQTLTISSKAV